MHNLCHAQNDGVHIPHPTDCSKFVQCDKSCAVVKICANGTAFDDSLGNCNHEYLVNCPEISKKAITDFSNLARSDRKFGGTAPKNPNPNYIEIQMEDELKLSKIETEYDDDNLNLRRVHFHAGSSIPFRAQIDFEQLLE